MANKYQIFCDNLSGMTWCPNLGGNTLEESIQNIKEQLSQSSQHYMYYIYALHQENVSYWGQKPDIYRYVNAVAGRSVEPINIRHKEGLYYALTIWEEDKWLFADRLFDD
jgi:hypothetical protein